MSSKESRKEPLSSRLLRLPANDVADCVLLLRKDDQPVYILGSVTLQIVTGSLSILGHNLTDDRWYPACSNGSNLVTLQCSSRRCVKYSCEILSKIVDKETRKAVKVKLKRSNVGCVIFLKANWLPSRLQCEQMFDFSSATNLEDMDVDQQNLLQKTADLGFTLFFDLPNAFTPLVVSPGWKSIPGFIQSHLKQKESGCPVILICGGKNVGKSTFARYLTNKLLNMQRSLYFLETDVGQSEFTPPGILSLTKVDTPIFGPPFVHLSKPERAFFFGDVSPKDRPSTYVQMIYVLHKYYTEYCREMPLIVNTCGWVKGMGVRILLDIIRIVQPSHLIQINSDSQPTKNLPELTEELLLSENGWTYQADDSRFWTCPPHIYQMEAFSNTKETAKGLNLQASELRSLSLLSYFGSNQATSCVTSVQEYILQCSTVYSRSLCSLEIFSVCDNVCSSELLHSINASVVALVRNDDNLFGLTDVLDEHLPAADKIQFGEYVGLGIVRNIDIVKRILYIITPEPREVLNSVNGLVKGRLEILDSLYKKVTHENRPYVTSEFTYNHRGSGQKRVRYNLLRQRSPHSPKYKVQKTSSSS